MFDRGRISAWWWWWWWWWWTVFVVWLTNERRLSLFPAGTIVKDPHHCQIPDTPLVEWSCEVVITTTPRRLYCYYQTWDLYHFKIFLTVALFSYSCSSIVYVKINTLIDNLVSALWLPEQHKQQSNRLWTNVKKLYSATLWNPLSRCYWCLIRKLLLKLVCVIRVSWNFTQR